LHRFDAAVARAVAAVKADPAADALRALLELRAERVGAHGVVDAVAYVRQLGQVTVLSWCSERRCMCCPHIVDPRFGS